MVNDPYEIILDHLRAIRGDIVGINRRMDTLQSDTLNVRKDINALRGEMLRFEEGMATMAIQIDRINVRLGLNET